ncbi:hypothetical protein, partial [Paenibacillus larvae]|uniref:hypothetical protein n=1 Tax=Paenibacillus larvae TaxID=1464 RepID=UPI0039FBBC42
LTEGYEYGSFHFLEPSFLHNYTDSTKHTTFYCLLGIGRNQTLLLVYREGKRRAGTNIKREGY